MTHGIGFSLVRALIRLLLAVFYRRIEVVGAERVPARGGLIVAANHHNSVVDAMLLLAVVPRRLRTLANAPLFRHPLIGPFLRLLGALPVHRRKEAGDDPRKNEGLFEQTTRTLAEGGGIVIFPEGRTQPEPVLLELRTGTARMLLAAQPAEVTLLPAGLVFQKPGIFREGHALVLFGEAVPTRECREQAHRAPGSRVTRPHRRGAGPGDARPAGNGGGPLGRRCAAGGRRTHTLAAAGRRSVPAAIAPSA
jgi:1-acyl-sn-glycerol-3-phosphate acyltransferase